MSAKLLQINLFLASGICFLVSVFWFSQRYGLFVPKITPTGSVQVQGEASYSGKLAEPYSLSLPDLELNLPIVITHMEGKTWPTTPSGISYLANTAVPGDVGNSVFYGHNWPSLLGNLKKAQIGEKLEIHYADGSAREFTINNVFIVSANSTDILKPTENPQITLYTCIGFLDSKRLVVTAI